MGSFVEILPSPGLENSDPTSVFANKKLLHSRERAFMSDVSNSLNELTNCSTGNLTGHNIELDEDSVTGAAAGKFENSGSEKKNDSRNRRYLSICAVVVLKL